MHKFLAGGARAAWRAAWVPMFSMLLLGVLAAPACAAVPAAEVDPPLDLSEHGVDQQLDAKSPAAAQPPCQPERCIEAVAPDLGNWTAHHCPLNVSLHSHLSPDSACYCSIVHFDDAGIMRLLAGTRLVFVGDSTMRRAAYQLVCAVEHNKFADTGASMLHTFQVAGSPVAQVEARWLPRLNNLNSQQALSARRGGPRLFSLNPDLESVLNQTVYVLAYFTHDILPEWMTLESIGATRPFLEAWATNVSHSVARFQQAMEPGSILMFRLPIYQCCQTGAGSHRRNFCDPVTRVDPMNAGVRLATKLLRLAFHANAPGVPLLPMGWTMSADAYDRHSCAPCDNKGTHFDTSPPRLAFVQQVLNGIQWVRQARALESP